MATPPLGPLTIAPAGTTTAVTACQAEATRRVATFGDLSDATKATMVAALTAQLLAEGWGAAAVAVATAGLDPLRIAGAESLPPTQVFAEISKAINKSVPEVLTSISVERGSVADEGSAMFMSRQRATACRAAPRAHERQFSAVAKLRYCGSGNWAHSYPKHPRWSSSSSIIELADLTKSRAKRTRGAGAMVRAYCMVHAPQVAVDRDFVDS